MAKFGVILSSTREGRSGEKVSKWVMDNLKDVKDATFELIDLKEVNLPVFESALSPKYSDKKYGNEITQNLSAKLDSLDGFIIIAAEYNHGYTAPLKNLLDTFYYEWNNKPVAFVTYGGMSAGTRAQSQLRQVVVELKLVPTSVAVNIPMVWSAFDEQGNLNDANGMLKGNLSELVTQLISYSNALEVLSK